MSVTIRSATLSDAGSIAEIYNYYIKNTVVTFEKEVITADEMSSRMELIIKNYPFIVAEADDIIVGYSYATQWKPRAAYFSSAESTVYLKPGYTGKGVGFLLYRQLFTELLNQNIHLVIGGISLPNEASEKLHLKCGFELMGTFREVGHKLNRWVDVRYYQKILQTI
ncbi:MAG: GNAT family N-acetyltransferase [Bacteroidetes bacterium]|nr:GNAT family N-acetyltransferase [Bacteroidota bacterium]